MLKAKIQEDLKVAQKKKDGLTISVLRMLLAEIHNREIQKRGEISEDEIISVLSGSMKKHQDSISQFQIGGRTDLVTKEEAEAKILKSYLPEPLGGEELERLTAEAIAGAKATGLQDFGKVMKELMPKIKGRVDGNKVSELVKEKLNKS